jgi:hypothetical protein
MAIRNGPYFTGGILGSTGSLSTGGGAQINDSTPSTTTVYSGTKTQTLIDGVTSSALQIDDITPSTTTVYSGTKTQTLVDGVTSSALQIDDITPSASTVYSGTKTQTLVDGVTSSIQANLNELNDKTGKTGGIWLGNTKPPTQDINTIAIGDGAGGTGQNKRGIAIGMNAGQGQTFDCVAIGTCAGQVGQLGMIAIGSYSGNIRQKPKSIAIGNSAGRTDQGDSSIAIGLDAGNLNQKNKSLAIGAYAGNEEQGSLTIAFGDSAGRTYQGKNSVALGVDAGRFHQNYFATKAYDGEGNFTGYTPTGDSNIGCVALGYSCGHSYQQPGSICIGPNSGKTFQGQNSIALGYNAGVTEQGSKSIAIGHSAGRNTLGENSIAIGAHASENVALDPVKNNTIVLNATGSELKPVANGCFQVKPVRTTAGMDGTYISKCYPVAHNTDSGEFVVDVAAGPIQQNLSQVAINQWNPVVYNPVDNELHYTDMPPFMLSATDTTQLEQRVTALETELLRLEVVLQSKIQGSSSSSPPLAKKPKIGP